MSWETDLVAKLAAGMGALGAAWYGFVRMVKKDRREDKVATLHDDAIEQVIKTLREEVERLTRRLELVEEQNRRCEERNEALRDDIIAMKKQLHLF
jgi:hypothetical protein